MWRKILVHMLLGLVIAGQLAAKEDCDCEHPPWPEECSKICSMRIINTANSSKLRKLLDIEEGNARAIVHGRESGEYHSIKDLRRVLSEEEVNHIKRQFERMVCKHKTVTEEV